MLLSPLFCVGSLRMCPEIFAARGTLPGVAFTAMHVGNVLANMFSPRLMARRARLVAELDLQGELERVTRPTLVITGEASLDRVVPDPTDERVPSHLAARHRHRAVAHRPSWSHHQAG